MFLELAPEFGGTRFGPFPQGAALGSDSSRCHITLPAAMGIAPVHAWISPAGAGWVVRAVEASAAIFVVYGGNGAPAPVRGSAPISAGDAVMLGNPQGPRFTLALPPPAVHSARGGPRQLPTAGAMAQEVKRQVGVGVMTSGSGAQVSQLLYKLRSGALLQPRYIIAGILGLGTAAAAGCSGLAAVIWGLLHTG